MLEAAQEAQALQAGAQLALDAPEADLLDMDEEFATGALL